MFSYNRYPYNCASVQRALLAPEILNESFLKCRYFTALYCTKLTVTPFDGSVPSPGANRDLYYISPILSYKRFGC